MQCKSKDLRLSFQPQSLTAIPSKTYASYPSNVVAKQVEEENGDGPQAGTENGR